MAYAPNCPVYPELDAVKWFDVVTWYIESQGYEPSLFNDVDIDAARKQIGGSAALVSQTDEPPFTIRNTHESSGQTDGS